MTNTPKYFDVTINGRKARMRLPSEGQLVFLQMIGDGVLDTPAADQVSQLGRMFLALLETAEDRSVFAGALACGDYGVPDFLETFRQIVASQQDAPAEDTAAGDGAAAKKRAVKRTASARTVSGRKKTSAAR